MALPRNWRWDYPGLAGSHHSAAPGCIPVRNGWGEALQGGEYNPADYNSDKLVMAAVKLVADGSIQGYTGYLSEPYYTPFNGDAAYRGYPAIPREKLFAEVEALHKAGYQLAIHGNGDAAIEDILDAFEAARSAPGG